MVGNDIFRGLSVEAKLLDTRREKIMGKAREALRLSKAAIGEVHAGKGGKSRALARSALDFCRKEAAGHPRLLAIGALNEALEEYAEACCFEGLVSGKLPSPKSISVDTESYICGLCDAVGELVRYATHAAIAGDVVTVGRCRDSALRVHEGLCIVPSHSSSMRHKLDALTRSLDRLDELALRCE